MTPAEAIAHLKTAGFTERSIGESVGVSQSAINKISRGDMNPNWALGQSLVELAVNTPVPDPNDPDAGRIGPAVETC